MLYNPVASSCAGFRCARSELRSIDEGRNLHLHEKRSHGKMLARLAQMLRFHATAA